MVIELKDRLNIISYRCPTPYGKGFTELSTGGLVASLYSLKSSHKLNWICYDIMNSSETNNGLSIKRIKIDRELNEMYYGKYCNSYIWPLFHYISNVEFFDQKYWLAYKKANEIMAEAISKTLNKQELIIINDYHLSLLPQMLKEKGYLKISFFWHIPWINYEYVSRLPNLNDIVKGILGSDIIGFHTKEFRDNFIETARYFSIEISESKLKNIKNVPIGLNTKLYELNKSLKGNSEMNKQVQGLKRKGSKVIGSISRLDMTKGIIQKIQAMDYLLDRHKDLIGKIVLIMVVSPSRTSIKEYSDLKKEIDRAVGNVNSKFRTLDWSPILYIYRRISQAELVSIMKNSDIFLITPIKDGLNLVAEEYLLLNDTGIPIISKFAGISNYLNLVPKVNPYDPIEVSETIFNIINEDKKEIKRKNLEMTKIVKSLDIFNWLNNMIL